MECDLSQLEINSGGNLTFVIEDPMKKVYMGDNCNTSTYTLVVL